MIRRFYKPITLVIALIWLVGQTGCIPQKTLQNIVLTEDVIYISGEIVRITGRVLETDGNVDEHGFHIAKDPEFSSPIIISLGPKTDGLGRFIGEYELLNIDSKYYFRSFANINGTEVTGQIKEFKSLNPGLESFSPRDGIEGSIITIKGINLTRDSRVLIDGKEVIVLSVIDETAIRVNMPPIGDKAEVSLSVIVQDTSMVFPDLFAYHFGHWELETTFFSNLQLYEIMWQKEGNEFIFGLGAEDNFDLNLNIWSLDLTTYAWTDLNFPSSSAARSPFNSSGYWGAGLESRAFSSNELSPYFWHYSSGTFTIQPFLPFRVYKSVALTLNGDLYVFGRELIDFSPTKSTHRFQELTNSWESIPDTPIEITSDYPYFSYNNEAYFVQPDGRIWRFRTVSGQWDQVGQYPDDIRELGVAVVLNDKAYIGLFDRATQLWEWDISNNIWLEKAAYLEIFVM